MPILRSALPILLALLLLPAAALAGPKKEFSSDGFSWSLPDDWSFGVVSPGEKQGGIVAKAECDAASVVALVFVQQSDLEVSGRVNDVKGLGAEGLGSLVRQAVKSTTLSGVKGKVVIKKIKPQGGGEGHFRTYIIKSGGKFYQLIIQAWHGSHVSQTEGINGIRKGFRLLKGAGGDDQDEPLDEVEGGSDDEDGEDGEDDGSSTDGTDGSDGAEEDSDWPRNGPKREGRCVKLPERNLHWTLPDGSALRWVGAIEDIKAESGRFVWALGVFKRKKGEFEKNTPDSNRLIVDLIIQKAPPGFKGEEFVKGGRAQNLIQKQWRVLEDIDASKTRTKGEVKIGNHKGAYAKFEGSHDGARRVVMFFATVLKGDLYLIRGIGDGHTDVYKHLAPKVGKALKGIEFLDTKEMMRGPLQIESVPDFAALRGSDGDKKKSYTLPGCKFEKPKGMRRLQAGSSMERELRWAGEMRSEDGEAYLYFDVSAWQLNISNRANVKDEDILKKRSEQWAAGAGDNALLSKKGKPPFFKNGRFGKGKGITYKFTGHLGDVPFTEEGWIVKYKSNMLRFRFQYGGVDAEKKLKKLIKAVKKGVKFKK